MKINPHGARDTRSLIIAILVSALLLSVSGCVTRNVRTSVIDRFGIKADLVRRVEGLKTQDRGFEHPAIISVPRLTNILHAIEVESPSEHGGTIRQPAFHPEIIERTAKAVAEALAESNPDQEVAVQVIRREMNLGILHQKYLTSFLLYIDDGHLYLLLKRVEWFVPKGMPIEKLPKPRRSYRPMNFRVVSGEPLFYAGPQTLEIAWRDSAFQTRFRLPGATKGAARRREVLLQSPIPKAELEASEQSQDRLGIGELSPDQLRALASLEEDRRGGLITESAYQRAKRELLRPH